MRASRRQADRDTASRILDTAERLVQTRGFNGFSYADIAAELGITKASLHYHFASKADLGGALIDRYAERFARALQSIDADGANGATRLAAYVEIYSGVLRDRRMCLCGMLAADYSTLPRPMQEAVVRFFDANESWLAGVLEQGAGAGELRLAGSSGDAARTIVSGLEGAMLVARTHGDLKHFEAVADQLLRTLAGSGAKAERV